VVSEVSTTSQRKGNENFQFSISSYYSSAFLYFGAHLWNIIYINQQILTQAVRLNCKAAECSSGAGVRVAELQLWRLI